MSETNSAIMNLWELSELESKLALNPTAAGYRELASRYASEGWREDSSRVAQMAATLPDAAAVTYTGAFNPRAIVEILRVLHLTGKSGELRLAAPGGVSVRIAFSAGLVVGAEGTDASPGEEALVRTIGVRGGCYEFVPGTISSNGVGALSDTAGTISRLAGALP